MIKITITKYNFEHDLYALVRSFYPGEETEVEILEEVQERYVKIQIPEGKVLRIDLPEAGEYEARDRIELKTYVKRLVYETLSAEKGQELAWGTLTGIRPTKLAMQKMEQGWNEEETEKFLEEYYLVSGKKASLCVEIAKREQENLAKLDYRNGYSLYIGIPFCPTRCLYCSFTSYPIEKWASRTDEYVDALCKEIRFVAETQEQSGKHLDTAYMGGGTPTTLTASQMDRVLTCCEDSFHYTSIKESWQENSGSQTCSRIDLADRPAFQEDFSEKPTVRAERVWFRASENRRGKDDDDHATERVNRSEIRRNAAAPLEFTVEAGRPDSITREKLQVIYDHGIRRISINPQTMQQRTLDLIGRRHTVEDIRQAYAMAREVGFTNINMDLIVGLPGETYDDVASTMEEMKKLRPDSLTVHSLAIKRAARLNTMKEAYADYKITNTQEIIDMTVEGARKMGLLPYYLYRQKNMAGNFENVGYAEVDKAGIYNILIMEEKQTIIACGAGGSTKIVIPEEDRIERVENVKDVGQYIARIDEMIERKKKWL